MSNDAKDYDDRKLTTKSEDALPKPQIEIIVDGNSVFKPGMKTYFVDGYDAEKGESSGKVMGEYCTCDTVVSTHVVCTCESVCTCEAVCSCNGYQSCSCVSNVSGGGGSHTVSCGSPCACVPVH